MSTSPNIRKEDRRIIKTKKLLKQSLLKLMDEKPLDHITISNLCEYAEINRNTFYYHYAHIGELLDEIINDNIESLKELSTGITDFCKSQSVCELYDFIFKHKTVYITLLIKNTNTRFLSALNEQTKSSLLPALLSFNPDASKEQVDIISSFIADAFLSASLRWLCHGYDKAPEKEVQLLILLLEQGIFEAISSKTR